MGMLEDENAGLSYGDAEKSRAMYLHTIDPENNPDPNAQEPIPVWGPEGPPDMSAPAPVQADVQSEDPYINNNVQEEIVDEDDPFAEFDEPAAEEEEDPFAQYDEPSAEPAEIDDPFSAYPMAEVEPEPEPEPIEEEEGNTWDAMVGGGKTMWNSVKTSWEAAFSDNEAIEELALESRGIKKTKAQEDFGESFAKNIKGEEDDLLGTIGGAIQAAVEEPRGALHESAAQAANMAPIWAGGFAGGKIGAVAGTAILPGVGTAVGAVVGAVAGMFTGNLMIEGGFAVQEEAQKPGMITDEQITEAGTGAIKKAAVITAIDTLTMGANRLMMGAPGRAASTAVTAHLASKGIDAADNLATRAALEASPELLGEVMEISAKTLFEATGSVIGKKGVRATVGLGLETTSEGFGEYLGTLASGKDATYGEAVLEALMAGPTSVAELAFVSTYKTGKDKLLGPTKEAAAELESSMEDAAETVAEAVDVMTGPMPETVGPLPQTTEEAEAEVELQVQEAEQRVLNIENAQDSARERVLANGGDTLDAELEASKVAQDMGAADDDIQRHLGMVNRQTEQGIERREEEAKEKEKVTKENAKSKIQEARKRIEEDKAYDQKDKSGLGQTGDVGHIAADTTADETVAGKDGDGVVRGNQMAEALTAAANEASTSPTNELKEPSPAQIESGNYKKGHVRKHGLDITIENPAGSTRKAADGSWSQSMSDHYGYIKGTESAEGKTEQLDVFIGEGDGIFVVDQINEDGSFDEHKVMMGYGNSVEARRAYARNYPPGFKVGKITPMSPQKFKEWLKNGDQTQPISNAGVSVAASAGQKKEVILSDTLEAKRDTRTLSAAEQAEDRIEKMPGRKVRYRREDTEETIQNISPADVKEELDYLIEGYEEEDQGNYKLALEDAIDEAEEQGNKKFLNKLRKVGIEIGMYREMPQEEIDRTSTTRGNVWDFSKGGKKYVYNSDGYKTEMQEAASADTRLEGTKIVDEQGVPLVVYRGVDAANADKTRKDRVPTFSPNKYVAGDYAGDFDEGVVSSYRLNITNPVDLDTGEDVISMKQLKKIVGPLDTARKKQLFADMIRQPYNWRGWEGGPVDNQMGRDSMQLGKDEVVPDEGYTDSFEIADTTEFVELMKMQGYDGIIIRGPFNATDAAGVIPQEEWERMEIEGEVEYRPFSNDQIITEMDKTPGTRETKKGIRYRKEDTVEADTLLSKVEKDGDGFTVDNATGRKKGTGFAAGIGLEKEFKGKPTAAEVDAYREKHAAALAEKGNYLGGWMSGGNFFLDVSKVYPNNDMGKKRAYENAKSRGEWGIQDLSKSAEEGYIPIDYKEGERESIRAGGKQVRYRKEEADGDKYFDEQAFKDVGPRFNSRVTLVYMSPDEFLQMAERLNFPNEQKAREVKELADEGTAYNSLPLLTFDNEGTHGQTVQHEGRHRAMELKSRGVTSMPVKFTSGEQGSKHSFRWDDDNLTLPKTLKGQSGNEIAFPKDAQATPEATPEVTKDGRAFKNFFSAVTKGLTGTSSTGAEYTPVIGSVRDAMSNTASAISKYSTEYIKHRGKFDDHIAFSIPGYKEVQQAVGAALAEVYGKGSEMLDIGASEGSFAKAVTAISGMKSTSLDPNPDMERSFQDVSTVPGAEYSMTALGEADQEGDVAWTEEDGTEVQYYDPMGKTFDVVHEAMVFQFVSNERQEQIARVKQLVSADGLFITEEKVFTTNQAANEALKNKDHKSLYFEQKDLDAKSAEVLEGMHQNMVHDFTLEEELTKNFKYVTQIWDSGNFKGYMASDSKTTLDNAVNALPDMSSDFATTSTPRVVSGAVRKRIGGEVNVAMTSAKAKTVLAPLLKKMQRLAPKILANPSEAPAALRAQMEKDNALKAKGVFDPETGDLYIFSENHDSDADVVRTLLHEGVAHKGTRILLGDKFEETMLDVFANGDKAAMARIARRYGLDSTKEEDKVEIAEEYIAFLAENDVKSTVLQRVVAAVRRVFRSVGALKNWSDNDLHVLLRRSRKGLKGKPMRKAMIKKSFIVAETGEIVDVETSADVELRNIKKRKDACERLRKCVK